MEIVLRWVEALATLAIAGFAAWVTFRGHKYETSAPQVTWLRPSFYRLGEIEKEEWEGSRLLLLVLVSAHNTGGQPAIVSNMVLHVQPPEGPPFPLVLQYELEGDPASGSPFRLVPVRPLQVKGHTITTRMWGFGLGDITGTGITPPPERWGAGNYIVKGFVPPCRQPKFRFSIHVSAGEQLTATTGPLRLSPLKRAQELVAEQTPFLSPDFVTRSFGKGA